MRSLGLFEKLETDYGVKVRHIPEKNKDLNSWYRSLYHLSCLWMKQVDSAEQHCATMNGD